LFSQAVLYPARASEFCDSLFLQLQKGLCQVCAK
jgi:hypothetical protein